VRSPDAARLTELLTAEGGLVTADDGHALTVGGLPAPRIGELAARAGLVVHELTPQLASLEEAFMELTRDSVEYGARTSQPAATATQAPAEGTR
jgi:ABC-2 type transport system ATP-binding protein